MLLAWQHTDSRIPRAFKALFQKNKHSYRWELGHFLGGGGPLWVTSLDHGGLPSSVIKGALVVKFGGAGRSILAFAIWQALVPLSVHCSSDLLFAVKVALTIHSPH